MVGKLFITIRVIVTITSEENALAPVILSDVVIGHDSQSPRFEIHPVIESTGIAEAFVDSLACEVVGVCLVGIIAVSFLPDPFSVPDDEIFDVHHSGKLELNIFRAMSRSRSHWALITRAA